MALVWFVDKFPRSRKPVQYRRLDDLTSFHSNVDRLKRHHDGQAEYPGNNAKVNFSISSHLHLFQTNTTSFLFQYTFMIFTI